MTTSEELREQARNLDREAQESFDRCDTDGFVSQWASSLTAQLKRKQAELKDNGGWYEFPALFDLEGNRVRAKLETRSAPYANWLKQTVRSFYDENDIPIHKYIKAFPVRASTLEKKGYKEGKELADAEAFMDGQGYGLSGSAWVSVKRLDNGYPVDAKAH